jgi:ElaB/YqjD/DUF883 family membrane-anchored ribosome-binding protein
MARSETVRSHNNVEAALRKLKDDADAKEMRIIEVISSMYETLKDSAETAAHKVEDSAKTVNKSVHANPWAFIGGAAVCAFLLGLVVRR